jgi:signal transduction histidine kinase
MAQPADSSWERWDRSIGEWIPYVTLAISLIVGLIQPGQSPTDLAVTVGLAVLAALWVFGLYTRAPRPRDANQLRMILYFTGLMVIGSVLMSRQAIYFVFMITGFFHAASLRPWPLTVLGIAATSILINTITTGFPWPTVEQWTIFSVLIIVQTLVLGFGTILGERLAEQSRQRKEAVARLEEALAENAGLQAQLMVQAREAGILDERQRMAREIHDTLAQGLTGIITQLEAAEGARERPNDRQRHLDNAAGLARESLMEARRSVEGSRPLALEGVGLPDALADVARQWSAMNGVRVEVTTTGDPLPLHPDVEVALLRTAQEALANVARHANASRVGLTLSYMDDEVTLDVRDDGIGFAPVNGSGERGFGLIAMRQRVSRVAGTLSIESEPGGGTAVSARVPAITAQGEEPQA